MSVSKHLINNPDDILKDSLSGFCYANNSNVFAPLPDAPNVIVRKDYADLIDNKKVAIISGGGSGHEPSHSGFVGKGMLTAAVCGEVFASPSTSSILSAIRLVGTGNDAGVLLIVKSYTGDRLNFGTAAKRAQLEGIKVETVLVNDDVSFLNDDEYEQEKSVGRRGLAGTVFIHKLAGALAEQGKSLAEIKETLSEIIKNKLVRTIGVSLMGGIHLPKQNIIIKSEEEDDDDLEADEIEIGFGIHGERGREQVKLTNSYDIVKQLFEYLEVELESGVNTDVCLLVNNLGSVSNFELGIVVNDCCKYLLTERRNFNLRRLYCGTFMTSLNMCGFSLSLFVCKNSSTELELLDLDTQAYSWPRVCGKDISLIQTDRLQSATKKRAAVAATPALTDVGSKYLALTDDNDINGFKLCLETICADLVDFKEYLNELDSGCGDGDCGNSLEKLTELIMARMNEGAFLFNYPHQVFMTLSKIMEQCGGTLCALLALASSAMSQAFVRHADMPSELTSSDWLKCWQNAIENATQAIHEYGGANANDRSFLDPLLAVNTSLKATCASTSADSVDMKNVIKNLVDVAYTSAESTANMRPRVGRASYVDPNLIKTPDAGAMAISSIVSSIYKIFLSQE